VRERELAEIRRRPRIEGQTRDLACQLDRRMLRGCRLVDQHSVAVGELEYVLQPVSLREATEADDLHRHMIPTA
jgi:hypothetical protein